MNKYDISIIIPFYRGNQYMERMMNCIKENVNYASNLKVEVVLVNDSPNVKIEYPNYQEFDVQLVINKQNSGIHYSRVNGINHANGKYILMLDQDDLIKEGALKSQFAQIKDNDLIISNGFDENPNNYGAIYHSHKHQDASLVAKYYYYVGCMIVSPGQCLIKKEAIPSIWMKGIIKNNGADDLMLWLIMMHQGKKIAVNYDQTYIHTFNGENVSANFEGMKQSALEVIEYLKKHDIISKENEKIYLERLKMRKIYEGKTKLHKILATIRYPYIAKELIRLKKM